MENYKKAYIRLIQILYRAYKGAYTKPIGELSDRLWHERKTYVIYPTSRMIDICRLTGVYDN